MALTREQVAEAAKEIAAKGQTPTYMSIREKVGAGSWSTISKYLREWKAAESSVEEPVGELPPAFSEVVNRFGVEVWKAASAFARAECDAMRMRLEEEAQATRQDLEAAGATIDELQEATKAATQEKEQLQEKLDAVRAELAKAQGALTEARERAKAAEARSDKIERDNKDLVKRLAAEAAKAGAATERLKHLEKGGRSQ